MRRQTLWCIWLSIGCAYGSPYYYQESKHQAEHHHEYYSSSHDSGQVPVSLPEGSPEVPQVSKPQRYSAHEYPSHVTSYSQGQGGGYALSQESSQHGSSYHSSMPVTVQQYVPSTSPVVVQRKVVRYYSYPASTTQEGYFHVSGSGIHGVERQVQSPVIVNQRVERFYTSGRHSGGDHLQEGQNELDLENIRGGHSFSTKEFNYGKESGQREIPEEPFRENLEIGQQEESIQIPKKLVFTPSVSSQKVERHYEIRRVGNLEYGQKQDLGQVDLGQREMPAFQQNVLKNSKQERFLTSSQHGYNYHNAKPDGVELGQKEEPLSGQEEDNLGQREEKESLFHSKYSSLETGQSLNPKHERENLEIGQKEELLTGQEPVALGQKEEPYIGQREENIGQTEEKESLYNSKYSSLEIGQKEEPLTGQEPIVLGQKEDSLIGQQEENLGQTEEKERLYHSKYSSLEIGQKEEPLQGFKVTSHHIGQGSLYENHESENLEIGQKEEPITGQEPVVLGQKEEPLFGQLEENLGQTEEKESLYNSKYSSLEVGQKEEPLQGFKVVSQHVAHHSHYQNHGNQDLLIGPRKPITGQVPVLLGHKEERHIGQKEENLGQTEEKESLYNNKYGSLEVGQKEEPLQGFKVVSQHVAHHSHYQNHGNQDLLIGPRKPITGQVPVLLGHKEDSLIGQQEENLGQTEEKESLYNSKYGSLEVGQKEEPLQGFKVVSQHVAHHSNYQNHGNLGLVTRPREPLNGQESVVLGQEEENLGQTEEKESSFHGKYSSLELGQQEVPFYNKPSKNSHRDEDGLTQVVDGNTGKGLDGQREEFLTGPIHTGYQEKMSHNRHEFKKVDIGKIEPIRGSNSDIFGQREQREEPFSHGQHRGDTELSEKEEKDSESVEHQPHMHGHHYHSEETHRHHNGRGWHHSKSCSHGEHHQHGGFGVGQKGHELEISNEKLKEATIFSGDKSIDNSNLNKRPFITSANNGGQGLIYSSSHRESNHTVQEISTSNSEKNDRIPPESPIRKVTGGPNKPFGSNLDLDKMIEDLAKDLETDGIAMKPNPIASTQSIKELTSTPAVHVAEIEELGSENLNSQSSLQSRVIPSIPQQVKIYETHKEESGYSYPTSRKTYSKKHSRHYSVRQESHSELPENLEQAPQVLSQYQSGGWRGYSQYGSSAAHLDDKYFSHGQPVKREADRHATIDAFLSELDREIASENKKPGQSGYVRVSSSQDQQSPSQSGSSFYSETRHTSQSNSSSSSGSGDNTSWFKKIGSNISSTYNKAKDKIGETFNQAKGKAKEMVDNVRDSF